jgi:hypothetical protein
VQPFEYIVQLVSILVGLALADLALSLHRLLRARGRVRWHWHAPVTALVLVLLMLDVWWGLRLLEQARVRWTIGLFLPMLVSLLGLFLLSAAALPDDIPADGVDLEAHYAENRRYFWGLFSGVVLLFTVHTITLSWLTLDRVEPVRLLLRFMPNLVVVVGAGSLAVVRRPWWHTTVISFLILAMLASYLARPLS